MRLLENLIHQIFIEFLVRFNELWSHKNLGTNLVFGDSKKRERYTFEGFLLKMIFDMSLKEWLSCER